jgi:hypothetical protein
MRYIILNLIVFSFLFFHNNAQTILKKEFYIDPTEHENVRFAPNDSIHLWLTLGIGTSTIWNDAKAFGVSININRGVFFITGRYISYPNFRSCVTVDYGDSGYDPETCEYSLVSGVAYSSRKIFTSIGTGFSYISGNFHKFGLPVMVWQF